MIHYRYNKWKENIFTIKWTRLLPWHNKNRISLSIVQKSAAVPLSWSFLNGLLNHVVKELNVDEVLKSPIFVVQKAAAPKSGAEFRQGSIGAIRSSLATSYDAWRRRATSPWKLDTERKNEKQNERISTCRSRAYSVSAGQKDEGYVMNVS